ncbi:hypothetical protein [Massilia genomosp. 1]|uniref:hypothetical protein n=1 Tax=Massilia genomosp. 1 TaxID=2609280 RepID=UPI00141FCE28|nr:hypothetical protein [Massilia genomosp. 1]
MAPAGQALLPGGVEGKGQAFLLRGKLQQLIESIGAMFGAALFHIPAPAQRYAVEPDFVQALAAQVVIALDILPALKEGDSYGAA